MYVYVCVVHCIYIYFVLLHIAFGSGIIFKEHVVWTLATFFVRAVVRAYLDTFGLYLRYTVHTAHSAGDGDGGGVETITYMWEPYYLLVGRSLEAQCGGK